MTAIKLKPIATIFAAFTVAALLSGCGDERAAAADASVAAAAAAAEKSPLIWSSLHREPEPEQSKISPSHFLGLWGYTPAGHTGPIYTINITSNHGEMQGSQHWVAPEAMGLNPTDGRMRLGLHDGVTHVYIYTANRIGNLSSGRYIYDESADELVLKYGVAVKESVPVGTRFVRMR